MTGINNFFLMSLSKCPKCGKFSVGFSYRDDWVGEDCTLCDWEKKHEEATADWIAMNKRFIESILEKHPEWKEMLAKNE